MFIAPAPGRDRLPTPVCLGFPGGSIGKESACNAGSLDSNPGWEDPRRTERLPAPEFWPGEFHGLYRESDVTERLSPGLTQ